MWSLQDNRPRQAAREDFKALIATDYVIMLQLMNLQLGDRAVLGSCPRGGKEPAGCL